MKSIFNVKVTCLTGLLFCTFMPNIALAETCKTDDPFPFVSPYNIQNCPADIQKWMDRANICGHFSGEESSDPDRDAEINEIMIENECDYVGCDARTLWAHYEGDIVYTRVISDYEEFVYGGPAPCFEEQELPPEERVGDEYLERVEPADTPGEEKAAEQDDTLDSEIKGAVKGILGNLFE